MLHLNGTTTKVADSITDEGDLGDTVTGTIKTKVLIGY